MNEIIVAGIGLTGVILAPLLIDIRKANREADARREESRRAAAELAAKAHSEALGAKDREIAYWRDLALSCLLPPGVPLPSGPEEHS
jgi:hypothetical protein